MYLFVLKIGIFRSGFIISILFIQVKLIYFTKYRFNYNLYFLLFNFVDIFKMIFDILIAPQFNLFLMFEIYFAFLILLTLKD